jgi:hypothetical protein
MIRREPSVAVVTEITCVVPGARPLIVPLESTIAIPSLSDIHRVPGAPPTTRVPPSATVTGGAPTMVPAGVLVEGAVGPLPEDELVPVVGPLPGAVVVAAGIRIGVETDTSPL